MSSEHAVSAARQKLRKAEEFMFVAEVAADSAFDAATSLAVSAAINAADAIMLVESGTFPQGDDHGQAVSRLRGIGRRQAAKHLAAVLSLKNKAQYGEKRCTAGEARDAIKHGQRLVDQGIEAARKGIRK